MSDHEHEIEFVAERGSYSVVITTALIVLVMAVFTWVMYGMARQVFVMTDVMLELNGSIKSMVTTLDNMSDDTHQMTVSVTGMDETITEMNSHIGNMNGEIGAMNTSIGGMTTDIADMSGHIGSMTEDISYMSTGIYYMGSSMSRMTYDVGKATDAFTSPMSYMFGNVLPF